MPDPFNPQSLNRYSYVYNNPLIYTDPSGYEGDQECYSEGGCKNLPSWVGITYLDGLGNVVMRGPYINGNNNASASKKLIGYDTNTTVGTGDSKSTFPDGMYFSITATRYWEINVGSPLGSVPWLTYGSNGNITGEIGIEANPLSDPIPWLVGGIVVAAKTIFTEPVSIAAKIITTKSTPLTALERALLAETDSMTSAESGKQVLNILTEALKAKGYSAEEIISILKGLNR